MADRTAQLNRVVLRDPVCVSPDTTVMEAMAAMEHHNGNARKLQPSHTAKQNRASATCVIVLEQNTVIGLLTAADMVGFTAQRLPIRQQAVREVLSFPPITARESSFTDLSSVLKIFEQHCLSHLPILDDQDQLVGLISHPSLLSGLSSWMNQQSIPVEQGIDRLEGSSRQEKPQEIAIQDTIEQELICKQYHLEALLNNIPHITWMKDDKSRFIAVNRPFAQASATTPEALVGKTDFDIYPAEIAQAYRNDDSEVLQSNQRKIVEEKFVRADGTISWIETTKTPFRDSDGNIAGTVGIAADITERRQIEAALAESEAKFRRLVEGGQNPTWSTDIEGKFTYLSPQFKDLTGWEAVEWIGKRCSDLVYSEDQAWVMEACEALVQDAAAGMLELRLLHCEQPYIWVCIDSTPTFNAAGELIGQQGTLTDINARKTAELALQESQTQFHRMTENVPGMIYRYVRHSDGTDELTYVSSQIREVFELEPEVALQNATQVWERIHPDDVAWLGDAIQASADTLQPFTSAYRLCLPNKGARWVQNMSHTARLANGDVAWDGIVVDITDRKQQEQERERLLKIVESTSDYIGVASAEGYILWHNQAFKNFRPDLGNSADRIHLSVANPTWAYELMQKEAFPTAIEQGIWSGESAILDADGNEVPISQVLIAHKSDEDEIKYFSTIIRNISERKAIERQLEFTQYGLDHAADCFYCLDKDANIKQVNQATCQHTGYTQEELLSMTLHELTPTCPKETTWAPHWEKLKRLKSYSFESVQRTKMGKIFPVEVVCNYLEFDGKAYDFELIRDITARKAAEAQRNQHLAAIEAAANGIAILKADRYVYLNHAHLTLLGYSSEELLGQSWQCIYSAEVLEYLEQEVFPLLAQDLAWQGEVVATRKDGSCFDQSLSLTLLDEDFVICVFSDISDRKQAEEKLQALSERLELALEGAQIGVWQWDYQSERLSWDERMFAIYGTQPEDFRGTQQDWEQYVHPDDLADAQEGIIRGDSRSSKEFRIIRSDGTVRYLFSTVFIQKNHKGECERAVGINLDITDRKQAEIALEEEVSRRSAVFNTSHDGIHILDRAGNLMEANTGFSQMLGYSLNELSNLNIADWDAQFSHKELQDKFQNYPANMHSKVETLHRRKDRTVFPVEITVCSMEWNGEFAFVCIARDISERKKYEMKLQQTNEELARATRLKDEFLANMSHELRTPLNSILGFSEALQEQILGPLGEKQITAVATIERSGEHLLKLINDILDVAKIESGKIKLDKQLTRISEVCNSGLTFVKQQAIKKGIRLTTNIPPHLPKIPIDERRILQVLINLLDNAVKFTPNGGEVTLEVSYQKQVRESDEDGTIAMPNQGAAQRLIAPDSLTGIAKNFITVEISDTGIGLSPADADKLFQPFIQIDSALNRKYEGTGLGLTLVKRIVELHDGVLTLRSEVGVGSCFSFQLPCQSETDKVDL